MIEITGFAKANGPLTKRISLGLDGKPISDGSACVMGAGRACRLPFSSIVDFAACIGALDPNEAIALGALRPGLPDQVDVVTKAKLQALNGAAALNVIARMAGEITYRPKQPGLVLLDYDNKGMPADVAARVTELGGFWGAVVSVVPELKNVARVLRRSTSAGLFRMDTGEQFAGSNGLHLYAVIADAADAERFLKILHARCWLAGLGWYMVGAAGQLLERSIVDRMVGAPERLVFEGAPVLEPPLGQDQESRKPIVRDGAALDTLAACSLLTIVEQATLQETLAKAAHLLAPERARAQEAFIKERSAEFIRAGKTEGFARRMSIHWTNGILLPDVELPFDDADLAGTPVRDVLSDTARFEGATLADPLEGIPYGRCKAKIMRRVDGTPWIHSFAHGRTIYELKLDAATVRAAIEKAPKDEVASTFVQMALRAELDDDELETLRNLTADRAGVGKRAIERKLKAARDQQRQEQQREGEERRAAERLDPRPRIPAPDFNAEWLPQMQVLNDVLGKDKSPEPPMRNSEGVVTVIQRQRVPLLHTLGAAGSNGDETAETRLPAPEHPLLMPLNDVQLAELIERHIEYYDLKSDKPVHLAGSFVMHYLKRDDDALPTVFAVATMPMILPDGTILSGHGLDRRCGVVFRVPRELEDLLPRQEACTATAVAEAMRFLTDEWLCDVATNYQGKCILVAMTMTILERLLLGERPAFFITAGQRGGGKTTAVNMISMAALGARAAAAAWSPDEEERRKALFSYLTTGIPLLMWDNIPRGAAISCPSIEKALTTAHYSDRVLGESKTRNVNANSVMGFTGNNIAPRGDLASRSLIARLSVDRPDPENRPFKHPDPDGWTEAHRGAILAALYTILLGNPRLRPGFNAAPAETRFKDWWHLVGSAVEHAAAQHVAHVAGCAFDPHPDCGPAEVSFKKLFLAGEAEEEQSCSLATVLDVIWNKWPYGCRAVDIAVYAGGTGADADDFRASLEAASGKQMKTVTARTITWALKAMVDAPVQVGNEVLVLRYRATGEGGHGGTFVVRKADGN